MRCSIVGRLDGTGECHNLATQLNACGHPVCDECAKDSAYIVERINLLARLIGESPRLTPTIVQSSN